MDQNKLRLALQNIRQAIETSPPNSDTRMLLELLRQVAEAGLERTWR